MNRLREDYKQKTGQDAVIAGWYDDVELATPEYTDHLESRITHLEQREKEAVELLKELRLFIQIAHRSLVINEDSYFASLATDLDLRVIDFLNSKEKCIHPLLRRERIDKNKLVCNECGATI